MIQLKLILSCLLLTGIGIGIFAALVNAISVRNRMKRTRQSGFTILEILIVVCILLILAGLAIPSLLQSKMRANEASAVGSLKTLIAAETTYQDVYQQFSPDLPSLGNTDLTPCTPAPTGACLVDGLLAGGNKSSYNLTYTSVNGGTDYLIQADPASAYAGTNSFCASSDSVIRITSTPPCTAASTPLP